MSMKRAKSLALVALVIFGGFLSGQKASASVEQCPPVVELRVFGFSVKVWAMGGNYTVEVVRSPVVKPSPVGR